MLCTNNSKKFIEQEDVQTGFLPKCLISNFLSLNPTVAAFIIQIFSLRFGERITIGGFGLVTSINRTSRYNISISNNHFQNSPIISFDA